jgi:hypothetical protein
VIHAARCWDTWFSGLADAAQARGPSASTISRKSRSVTARSSYDSYRTVLSPSQSKNAASEKQSSSDLMCCGIAVQDSSFLDGMV